MRSKEITKRVLKIAKKVTKANIKFTLHFFDLLSLLSVLHKLLKNCEKRDDSVCLFGKTYRHIVATIAHCRAQMEKINRK